MILCDPFAINTLALSTIRHLQDLVGQDTLPRVSIAASVPNLSCALGWLTAIREGLALAKSQVPKPGSWNKGNMIPAPAAELCRSCLDMGILELSKLTINSLHGSFCLAAVQIQNNV